MLNLKPVLSFLTSITRQSCTVPLDTTTFKSPLFASPFLPFEVLQICRLHQHRVFKSRDSHETALTFFCIALNSANPVPASASACLHRYDEILRNKGETLEQRNKTGYVPYTGRSHRYQRALRRRCRTLGVISCRPRRQRATSTLR